MKNESKNKISIAMVFLLSSLLIVIISLRIGETQGNQYRELTIEEYQQREAENEKRSIERKIRQKKQEELSSSILKAKIENLRTKWRSLNKGDTQSKVRRILGEPDKLDKTHTGSNFSYKYDILSLGMIFFDNNNRINSIYEPDYKYIKQIK